MQALGSQFRPSRLNIFLFDLRQALAFSQYILDEHLHDLEAASTNAKLVHLAFNTALIISYARPFHGSYEPDGRSRVSLSADAGVLDIDESAFHAQLLDKRDGVFAHSDARSYEIEGFNYDAQTLKFYNYVFDPLTLEETRLLRQMIRKWISHVESFRTTTAH